MFTKSIDIPLFSDIIRLNQIGGEIMDPEVEIQVIELADKWSDVKSIPQGGNAESYLKKKAQLFDIAYKSIVKTLGFEPEGSED